MADESRKRSRFDQEDPQPRRTSRFDRSRSPANNASESRRSRSPVSRRGQDGAASQSPGVQDAAAKAAAAAAKIKAQLGAQGRSSSNSAVPVRPSSASLGPGTPTSADARSPPAGGARSNEIYQQDGDYIRDIEVNNLKNRYTLTKGSTQKMIKEQTGADVTTRGEYYPDSSMATAAKPPLYLHITSQSKEGLEKAIALIEELKARELPNLVDERRLRRREPDPQAEREEHFGRRPGEIFGAKVPIDLEPIPGFNLRAQIVGKGGEYVKYIQSESMCKVQIKGRGSGYLESATNAESDEPMYLHVTSNRSQDQADHGQRLAEQLLENVREQYRNFKANGRGGHGGGHNRDYNRNDSYGNSQSGGYGGYSGGYGSQSSPPPPPPAGSPPAQDQSQMYAQYYAQYAGAQPATAEGGDDPYAAYGGYESYQRTMYHYYYGGGYAQQMQQQGSDQGQGQAAPPPPTGGAGAPPPPPPGAAPPGLESPPGASHGGYSSVPPPPGL